MENWANCWELSIRRQSAAYIERMIKMQEPPFKIGFPIEIKGEDSNYAITPDGEVINTNTKRILNQRPNNRGYQVVDLYDKDHEKKTNLVHRLVAKTYISNPDNLPTVNHLDGNKENNSVSNLEWSSYSDNNQHAYDTGLHQKQTGEEASNAKYTEEIVRSICSEIEKGLDPMVISEILDVPVSLVRSIKTKRSWNSVSDEYNFPDTRFYMPDDIRDKIKELHNSGYTINQICNELGWEANSIYKKRVRRAIDR